MKYADLIPYLTDTDFVPFLTAIKDEEVPEEAFRYLWESGKCALSCRRAARLYEEWRELSSDISIKTWCDGHMSALQMFEQPFPAKDYSEVLWDLIHDLESLRKKQEVKKQTSEDPVDSLFDQPVDDIS